MGRRALALALLAAALAAPAARADGDPASDVLLSVPVFVPFDVKLAGQAELMGTVRAAKEQGYSIRVALIPRRLDLGVVTPLWRKPQEYAQFLAQELAFVYRGRLLIAMPNGYGLYWCADQRCTRDRPLAAERRALAALPSPDAAGRDVASAAAVAVRRLAAANGIRVTAPTPAASTKKDTTGDRVKIGAAALSLLVLAGAVVAVSRYRRSRGRQA